MTISTEVLAIVVTLNIAVVGYLAKQISTLAHKLDSMVCDPLCKERSEKCQKAVCSKLHQLENEDKEIWKRINTHRHTDSGEVVVRE